MIIFINGSINAGKTTVSKLLQEKIPQTALVEMDSLRNFIDWLPIDEAIPITHENGISVIRNFVMSGFNVVVPYPLSLKSYNKFIEALKSLNTDIYAFTLSPKIEVAVINRGNRELDQKEVDRIHHHYKIGIHNPGYGVVIDNTNQSPEETAEEILRQINKK